MSCPRNSNCPARRASSCPRRGRSQSVSPSSSHRSASQHSSGRSARSQRSECDHLPRPIAQSDFYAHRHHADTSRLADDESSRYYDTSSVTEQTSLSEDSRSGRTYSDASSRRDESDTYCSCRSRNCTLDHSATDSQRSLRGPNLSAIHGSGSKHRHHHDSRSERSDGTYTVSSRRRERSPRPVTSTPRHAAHNNDKSKKSLLREVLINNAKRVQDEETTPSRSRRHRGVRPRSQLSKRHNNTRRSVSSSGSSKRSARRLFSDDSSLGLSTRLEFTDLGSDSLDRSLNSSIRSRNKSLSRRVLEKCELERSRQSCASPRRTKQITCALSEPLHISTKQTIQISPATGQLQVIATTAICCEAVDDESIASMLRYQPIICGKTSNHEGDDDSETTEQHVWIGRHSIYIERISNIQKVRRAVKTKTEREYEAVCDSRLGAKTVVGPLSLLSTEITRQKNGRVQKTEYIQLVFPKGRIESFPETCDTVKAGEYVSMGEHVELRNNVLRIRRTVLLHRSNTLDDSVWDEDHLISNDQARDYRVADKNGRLTVTELVEQAEAAIAQSPAPKSAESISPLKTANAAASHELADTAIADSKEELRTAMSAGSATALAASMQPKETEHKLRHVPEDKHNLAENLAAVYPRQVAFDKDNMKRTMEELKKRLQGERGLRALKENAVRLDSADYSDHQAPTRPASAPVPSTGGLLRGLQRDESESGKRRRAAEAHSVSMAADLFRYRTPSASRPPARSPLQATTASERERVWGKQCKVTRKESVENNAARAIQTTCPKMDLSKKSAKSKDSKAVKSRTLPITRTSSTVDTMEKNASACIDINTTGHMPSDVPNEVSVVKQLTLGCVINGVPWSLSVCFKLKMLPDQCDVVPTFITFDDKALWSAPQAPAAAEHKPVPEKPTTPAPGAAAPVTPLVKDVKTEAVSPAAPVLPAQQQLSDSSIGQDSKSADSQKEKSDRDESAKAEEKSVSKKSGGSKRSKRKGSSKRSQRSKKSSVSAKKADAPK